MKENFLIGILAVGAVGAVAFVFLQPQKKATGAAPQSPSSLPISQSAPPYQAPTPTTTKGQQCTMLLSAIRNHDTAMSSARERMNTVLAEAQKPASDLSYKAECRYVFGVCGGYGGEIVQAALKFVAGKVPSIFAGLNPEEGGAQLIRDNPSWSVKLVQLQERYALEQSSFDRESAARAAKVAQVETLRAEGVIC